MITTWILVVTIVSFSVADISRVLRSPRSPDGTCRGLGKVGAERTWTGSARSVEQAIAEELQ